jgi:ABC-2 type transport system ATP-binding protein
VEQVCDRVAIIDQGRLLREGTVSELVQEKARMCLVAKPVEKAVQVLEEHWTVTANDNDSLLVDVAYEDAPQVVKKLVEQEIEVYEITTQRQSLEDFFLSVTGGENNHVD